jgi:DNA-directed RNA polymerase II subunit RPB7
MFFHVKNLKKNLEVDPKDYGPKLVDTIKRKLIQEVENTCSERYGFILKVVKFNIDRLEGKILPTGMYPGGTAVFTIPYEAVVFKAFRGEVINGIVKTSAVQGVFVQCGPLNVFIARSNLTDDTNQLAWNPENSPPCWMSPDQRTIIKDGSHLRLKIIGIRMGNDIKDSVKPFLPLCCLAVTVIQLTRAVFSQTAVGTILDDYLGPIEA